jgi:hypothetical protein
MIGARGRKLLVVACVAALLALGLMAWSLFDPRPIPVILAMSVGQGLGTASLVAFIAVMVADLRARRRGERPTTNEPGASPPRFEKR